MLSIALNLKNAREKQGMTQAEVAAKVGITQAACVQFEKGIRIPNAVTLKAIADALEVPVGSLYEEFEE